MRVTVWVSKNISVDVEGTDDKALFKGISQAQNHEFWADSCCGKCGCEDLKYQVRTVTTDGEENEFYEIVCKKCYAKLSFGHAKAGGMYAKRLEVGAKGKAIKDENDKGIKLPNKGWLRFNKETGKNE